MHVLVTGGAGFVGSHSVDALLSAGHRVRVYDNLDPQVHAGSAVPGYLNPGAEFVRGDVRDREALLRALDGIDAVLYLAAAVGVGQSMYEILHYAAVNTVGGATFLDILANEPHGVRKVVVASSMSIYGEGAYDCGACGRVYPQLRPEAQLAARDWEMRCPRCGAPVNAVPTDENKPLFPTSIYAITKRDHEEMFLSVGRAYDIPTVALRYFNIYGPRQALSNPYTGVVAIFSSRMSNGKSPVIFEDGGQSRDFVHVSDIVQANMLALTRSEADFQTVNVGTGKSTSIAEAAAVLADVLEYRGAPEIKNQFRAGDIRHCFADIGRARTLLGYEPRVSLRSGLDEMLEWVRGEEAVDKVEQASAELVARGLVV